MNGVAFILKNNNNRVGYLAEWKEKCIFAL